MRTLLTSEQTSVSPLDEEQKIAQDVIACGMRVNALLPIEQAEFPTITCNDEKKSTYLCIRNTILCRWRIDISSYLCVDKAIQTLNNASRSLAVIIFEFLNVFGFINCGVITRGTPITYASLRPETVVVIGAGMAGISAAKQMQTFGHNVIVLEARNRIGGRILSDTCVGAGVDIGASIITGVEGNPLTMLAQQLNVCDRLHVIQHDCPLYFRGKLLDKQEDEKIERIWNQVLDITDALRNKNLLCDSDWRRAHSSMHMFDNDDDDNDDEAITSNVDNTTPILSKLVDTIKSLPRRDSVRMSLGETITRAINALNLDLSHREQLILNWHRANLEYGCASNLDQISLTEWDQDDAFGFSGDHCFVRGGYSVFTDRLSEGLDIRLSHRVCSVTHQPAQQHTVSVICDNGVSLQAHRVIVAVPLGVLQHRMISFCPALPLYKQHAIESLGMGIINKVVLRFADVFWRRDIDMFGVVSEHGFNIHHTNYIDDKRDLSRIRGRFFQFWSMYRVSQEPVLVVISSADAAEDQEKMSDECIVQSAVDVLAKIFGREVVGSPIASVCTAWKRDKNSLGVYSYVHKGARGKHYDHVASDMFDGTVFFAGEGANREHPTTVAGAFLSGLNTAGIIQSRLNRDDNTNSNFGVVLSTREAPLSCISPSLHNSAETTMQRSDFEHEHHHHDDDDDERIKHKKRELDNAMNSLMSGDFNGVRIKTLTTPNPKRIVRHSEYADDFFTATRVKDDAVLDNNAYESDENKGIISSCDDDDDDDDDDEDIHTHKHKSSIIDTRPHKLEKAVRKAIAKTVLFSIKANRRARKLDRKKRSKLAHRATENVVRTWKEHGGNAKPTKFLNTKRRLKIDALVAKYIQQMKEQAR